MYYTLHMSMGKRERERQPEMWVITTDLPTSASHPFYARLNQLLAEHHFDDFVEGQCQPFYAETMGRPGLPPVWFDRTGKEIGKVGEGQHLDRDIAIQSGFGRYTSPMPPAPISAKTS